MSAPTLSNDFVDKAQTTFDSTMSNKNMSMNGVLSSPPSDLQSATSGTLPSDLSNQANSTVNGLGTKATTTLDGLKSGGVGAGLGSTGGLPFAVSEQAQKVQQMQDTVKGATVRQFDPQASPADKAQQALKDAKSTLAPVDTSALPSLRGKEMEGFKSLGGSELSSDVGGKKGEDVKPTVGLKELTKVNAQEKAKDAKLVAPPTPVKVNGVIAQQPPPAVLAPSATKEKDEISKKEGRIDSDGVPSPSGALPPDTKDGKDKAVVIREIPSWFAIGWTGQDKTLFLSPEEAKNRSILEDFVSEAYYGAWWHNAGIIIFAVLAAHFVTLLGGGWGWLLIILSFTATYYEMSIKRTRRNARDDLAREVAKKGLKADVESATWLNLFMTRFWLIYEPVLSATIVASVDQVLSVSTPAFLDSIRMTTFTLGTKPPHIDHVRTFADTEDDVVMMEWKISFTPNDVKDMTYAAAARKVNPKIVLEIRFGVGIASVGKDIICEDISFEGTMRIKMKLMNNFPHVQTVDLSFMAPPTFDFILKPVGFDLSIIPGLVPFIHSQVHATLGPMMYSPNTFTLNLEQMLSGAPIDTAVGVLAVTVYSGRGLKGTKLGGGAPDPYVSLSIAGREELAKTAIKKSTTTPHWNETKYILLKNLNEVMSLTVKDWNEHRPDSDLGIANFDLKTLLEDGQQEGKLADVMLDAKPRGNIKFDAIYYPVLKPTKLADGTEEAVPETKSGVVRLVVHQAKELDPRGQQINPFFNVTLNDKPVHRSQTLKRTPSPIWERATEFLVTEKQSAVIGISVLDDNSLVADSKLGTVKVKLTDIFEAKLKGQDWFPLSGVKSGRVRLSAEWKPVLMAGAINGAGVYTPPIGVARVLFKRGIDLKNVEGLTGGKSDPYARVLFGGIVIARTLVVNNNLEPEWDEIVYIQVHSPKDHFIVEVMDYQHTTKDRTLGQTDLLVADLLAEGTDKKLKPWVGTGKKTKRESLKTDGKRIAKGTIEFDVEFFPCAHLKGISFSEPVSDAIKEDAEEEETLAEPASATSLLNPAAKTNLEKVVKKEEDPNEGIVIPRSELIKTQSGILAFQIISGQLSRRGPRLEVLFDDGYWPSYSTEPARSPHAVWDEIGEAFIRELDYSQVVLKLNTAEKETREDVIASATIDMNVFLESALDKPHTFTLMDANGGNRSTVTMAAKYIPVDIQLDPRESVNNCGHLRVELLDAKGIPAADRSGKSDPYAVFELDGEKVFKSEVVRKTLSPTWNQNFDTTVKSRVAAKFFVDVFDWDRVGTATKLGRGTIDLASLEPIESTEVHVPLRDVKTGKDGGTVRIKMVFKPAFVARSREATSTFSSAGRIATGLGGGVIGVGTGVVGAGASGVGSVGKGVYGGLRRIVPGSGGGHNRNTSASGSPDLAAVGGAAAVGGVGAAAATGYAVDDAAAVNGGTGGPGGVGAPGVLSLAVNDLTGMGDEEEKKFVTVKRNGKVIESTHAQKGDPVGFHQTLAVKTSEGPCELELTVLHKKTFGSDKVLATTTVNLWDHISPLGSSTATVSLPFSGSSAILNLGLSWVPTSALGAAGDDTASHNGSVSPSTKAKSRFPSGRFGRASREVSVEPSD